MIHFHGNTIDISDYIDEKDFDSISKWLDNNIHSVKIINFNDLVVGDRAPKELIMKLSNMKVIAEIRGRLDDNMSDMAACCPKVFTYPGSSIKIKHDASVDITKRGGNIYRV
jgi:hypothetical protein